MEQIMKYLISLSILFAISIAVISPTSAVTWKDTASSHIVDDAVAGWIWSGMGEYNSDSLFGGSGHAGGPGAYGAYTIKASHFRLYCSEPSLVTVAGRAHKGGRVKLSVDGTPVDVAPLVKSDDTVCVADISGLSSGYHVVQVSPEGGWIVVDYLEVIGVEDNHGHAEDNHGHAEEAQPVDGIREGKYKIVPRHNDTRMFGSLDGQTVVALGPDSGRYGVVTIKSNPDKSCTIASTVDPKLVFTMSTTAVNSGYSIILQRNTDIPAARWYITRDNEGYYSIANVAQPNYVVDVNNDSLLVDAPVVLWLYHGLPNQQWIITLINGGEK